MVYLIIGENAYIARRELALIIKKSEVEAEVFDVAELTVSQLADIVRAQTLFSTKRLVVCRDLSSNKQVWEKLAEWIDEISSDTNLVLIEAKADKRTKAYKIISKHAQIIAADQLTDRDWRQAESWLDTYVRTHKVALTRQQISDMVQRAMVPDTKPGRQLIDQQLLVTAVHSLAALPSVNDAAISTVMPETSQGTVFDILNYALTGERTKVRSLLEQLRHHDEALAVFPSLMSQWVQLVEIALVGERAAGELGIHPYVAQKLSDLAKRVPRERLKSITQLGARLDGEMKQSGIEPWDAIDRFVLELMMTN